MQAARLVGPVPRASLLTTAAAAAAAVVSAAQFRLFNCNRAVVTKVRRAVYLRSYPTQLVHPDGSTVTIRYHEPRLVVKLPLDPKTLTAEELRERQVRRKPKPKLVVEHKLEQTFDHRKYRHLLKK